MSQNTGKINKPASTLNRKMQRALTLLSKFTRRNKLVSRLPLEWNPETQNFQCAQTKAELKYWFVSQVLIISTLSISSASLLHELFAVTSKVPLVGIVVQVLVVTGLIATLLVEIALYYYRFEFTTGVNKLLLLCSHLKSGEI